MYKCYSTAHFQATHVTVHCAAAGLHPLAEYSSPVHCLLTLVLPPPRLAAYESGCESNSRVALGSYHCTLLYIAGICTVLPINSHSTPRKSCQLSCLLAMHSLLQPVPRMVTDLVLVLVLAALHVSRGRCASTHKAPSYA